mmetsp:Transcript_1847/g.4023  ORF Transcript_1847/g.4023 Transcript_1847/m.4023 type:complete len:337 (-) Transcript_1847:1880-2890(-)
MRAAEPRRAAPSPLFVLRGHQSGVSCARFLTAGDSQPSELLASGDVGGVVMLWDVQQRDPVLKMPYIEHVGSLGPVVDLVELERNRILARFRDGVVVYWDIRSANACAVLNLSVAPGFCKMGALASAEVQAPHPLICYSGDENGNSLAVVELSKTSTNSVAGDVNECKHVAQVSVGESLLTSIACVGGCTNDQDFGASILTGHEGGELRRWKFSVSHEHAQHRLRSSSSVRPFSVPILALSHHKSYIVCAGASEKLFLINTEPDQNQNSMRIAKGMTLRTPGISDLSWRPDGRIIAASCWDGAVRVLDGRAHRRSVLSLVAVLKHHSERYVNERSL